MGSIGGDIPVALLSGNFASGRSYKYHTSAENIDLQSDTVSADKLISKLSCPGEIAEGLERMNKPGG
jgi:hypothetical protein